jgi:hypothetical protein
LIFSIANANSANKALHRTAIQLRSIAAGELYRYADERLEQLSTM